MGKKKKVEVEVAAEEPKKRGRKKKEVVEEQPQSSGYRSAIRKGLKTPEQVLTELDKAAKKGSYVRPEFVRWLKNRAKVSEK